jgi:hypothetical protein
VGTVGGPGDRAVAVCAAGGVGGDRDGVFGCGFVILITRCSLYVSRETLI